MAENKVQDYTDEKNEGHVDTREKNFEWGTSGTSIGILV
jgi:hypothetical protein